MAHSTILYLLSQFFVQFLPMLGNKEVLAPLKLTLHLQHNLVEDSLLKHIYLSFDDGPVLGTANVMEVCSNHKASASFFEIGLHQSRSKEGKKLYKKILQKDSLFALCNHSFSHAYGKYKAYYHAPRAALDDFMHAQKILKPKNNILRLPGNNAWSLKETQRASGLARPLVRLLDSAGFNIIGWDMEWRFNKKGRPIQSPEAIAALVDSLFKLNQTVTKNHLVILMHDHMFRASEDSIQLDQMIALLQRNPYYHFEKLTQYPGLKHSMN
ncbi:MAG: polysaccharide deacetylase family protein [Chitinophagia bacterium]